MSTIDDSTAAPLVAGDDAQAPGSPASLRTTRESLLVAVGRAAVALVPVMIVSVVVGPTSAAVLETVGIALIFLFALRNTVDAPWLSPLALGALTMCTLGTIAGLAGATLLVYWVPGAGVTPSELLAMAAGVLIASAAFESQLVPRLVPPRRVLVVGASGGGVELVDELLFRDDLPFRCVGLVCDPDTGTGVPDHLVLGSAIDLRRIARDQRPDVVVLPEPGDRGAAVARLVDSSPVGFRLVGLPEFYEHAFGRVPIEHLNPTWFMSVLHLYQHSYSRATKRLLDIVLAGLALLVVAPVIAIAAVLVRRSGPGPVLFRQRRLGEGGRTFEMVKFRTMREGAEDAGQAVWADTRDDRVTSTGRILRRLRLDELPQLWNVLRGEMSFVGPRPERPEFLELLHDEVPFWTKRHLIKPGITGWAQVRCGYARNVAGAAEKLSYDLYYLRHRSLVLDLAITVKTVGAVLSGRGVS